MKISKQEEYGLRCILQLARAGHGKSVAVTEISKKEGLSTDYVTKLLVTLRRTGLVTSVRGINGGYTLHRPAADISLGEVMRSLGGFFYPKDICAEYPGKLHECCHLVNCGIRPIWMILSRQIYTTLNRTTLADMLLEEQEVVRLMAGRMPQPAAAATPAAN
ncbi:MAG: hypothetical protein A3G34_12690 [Candidatus Lindowbacteria bacterium RIFCSPLOWO2_12_FULL_62_27]|nr:MAG: hypothetical protein A3I06_15375 [Candidatus Lindowbacteria bacterium RIFCSPLOWO2_02_FULL_62_12]OGH62451.1 MAG: hypothetical protein A3G34_12690 [Candidatus Lindowbacteria bacterium RIFCSPLOWO2_12_FULL_62_27]